MLSSSFFVIKIVDAPLPVLVPIRNWLYWYGSCNVIFLDTFFIALLYALTGCTPLGAGVGNWGGR